ncbi:MAG: hypothetical protein AAGA09_03745 [Pseudomonadota bacterium]
MTLWRRLGEMIATRTNLPRVGVAMTLQAYALLGAATLLAAGVFLAPAAPFGIDSAIYYDMARAMADHGALHIASSGKVPGAPPLTKDLTVVHNGMVYPQFPGGYAFIAAPFYKAFGIRGLMAINAIAAGLCLWITYRLTATLLDRAAAIWAASILGAATYIANYAFGIWPHILALAFWLTAAWLALTGVDAVEKRRQFVFCAAAGFLVSVGATVRVDTILAAPAIVLWMRLVAAPEEKSPALAFLIGLLPGIAMATLLNHLKFGVLSPFAVDADGAGDLLWVAAVVLGFIALLFTADLREFALEVIEEAGRANAAAGTAIFVLLAVLLVTPLRDFFYGAYVLLFNFQAHAAFAQESVQPDEYGQLMFFGSPKRALVQSLPFAALICIPLIDFFRGRDTFAYSLCLLAIAAPIAFYSAGQWHGGASYNMRYFIPALPFIAILCAGAIRSLEIAGGGVSRQSMLAIFFVAALTFLASDTLGSAAEHLRAPLALYPQWILAAIAAGGAIRFCWRPQSRRLARFAFGAGLFALAYGGAINFTDAVSTEKTRAAGRVLSADIAAAVFNKRRSSDAERPSPLIVTQNTVTTIAAENAGAHVMTISEKNIAKIRQAVNAFAGAGACVYIQNITARDLLAPAVPTNSILRTPYWAPSDATPFHPLLAFYGLARQTEACAF